MICIGEYTSPKLTFQFHKNPFYISPEWRIMFTDSDFDMADIGETAFDSVQNTFADMLNEFGVCLHLYFGDLVYLLIVDSLNKLVGG